MMACGHGPEQFCSVAGNVTRREQAEDKVDEAGVLEPDEQSDKVDELTRNEQEEGQGQVEDSEPAKQTGRAEKQEVHRGQASGR